MNSGTRLLDEWKRRRVIRALVGYGIAAFAVLQVIEPIMHGLHWPDAVLSYAIVVLALGFPLVVTLAWIFDVKAGRIERTAPAAPPSALKGVRLMAVLLGIGLLAAAPGLTIYFFLLGGARGIAERRNSAASAPSIAVLPFVNMSGDKENEYFSDGITEELINALANIEGLRVASSTSVFALKGKNLDARQVGERLNVKTLLEGSVRREGHALRVTAQLINVSDDVHVWSKTYDRELKSIFALEGEIAQAIAQTLRHKLIGGRALKAPTSNIEAHDLYLKGRYFANKRNLEAFRKAADYFEKAIRLDPSYSLAHAGLADTLSLRIDYDEEATSELLPKAKAAALRSLELDPGLGEAHTSLGYVAVHQWDWTTAEKEYRTAIELKPDYATAHQWYAEFLSQTGHLQEARAEIRRALESDPTSPIIMSVDADIHVIERDFNGAIEQNKKALELDPTFARSRLLLSQTYAFQEKYAEALAELDNVRQWATPGVQATHAYILARAGRGKEAVAMLNELEQRSHREYVNPVDLARVHVALRDRNNAFALLAKACAASDSHLLWGLIMEPLFDPLRSDPRFKILLRCMHLE